MRLLSLYIHFNEPLYLSSLYIYSCICSTFTEPLYLLSLLLRVYFITTKYLCRSHQRAQSLLFPSADKFAGPARRWQNIWGGENPVYGDNGEPVVFEEPSSDPLKEFELDLLKCAKKAYEIGYQWYEHMQYFPYLTGLFANPHHGPALARAVLIEKKQMSAYVEALGSFPGINPVFRESMFRYGPVFDYAITLNPKYTRTDRMPRNRSQPNCGFPTQTELTEKYCERVRLSIDDEARRQGKAFKSLHKGKPAERESAGQARIEKVKSERLFDSFMFLEGVMADKDAFTEFLRFASANTPVGVDRKQSPYIADYPALHKLFKPVAGQLTTQQQLEGFFGKVDNINQNTADTGMRAQMVLRENRLRNREINRDKIIAQLAPKGGKLKRKSCKFENKEYKSDLVRTEVLAAGKKIKLDAKQSIAGKAIGFTDVNMNRMESKAATEKSSKDPELGKCEHKLKSGKRKGGECGRARPCGIHEKKQ